MITGEQVMSAADTSTPSPDPVRASDPQSYFADNLGPLAELAGTWIGNGYNVMSLPNCDVTPPSTGPKNFRLKLNATREVLQFIPIGGPVPNRGAVTELNGTAGQCDINLYGLTYLQRVSDAVTNDALHVEPGIWLNVPATAIPEQDAGVVRMGSVPHGNSLLAQSHAVERMVGPPRIGPANSKPAGLDVTPEMLAAFTDPVPPLPPGLEPAWVVDPNKALIAAISGQTIISNVQIQISTSSPGGILNIPFATNNAMPLQLDAIFWIETVQRADGSKFMQLQYTQTVLLTFLGINWPHNTVATLVKQ
jgi:hypothetical protein